MKQITYKALAAGLLLLLYACQEDEFQPSGTRGERIITNYSRSTLNSRVRIPEYEEMLSFYDVPQPASHARMNGTASASLENYVLVLRAEVEPPVHQNRSLRASHVHIHDNRAFVAYNTEGETYLGGIDIFDISNIKKPLLIAQVIVDGADFSAVSFHENKIYLAGARAAYEQESLQSPAIVEVIEINNDQITGEPVLLDVPGFTATDVKVHEGKLYVTSGTQGGLSIYSLDSLQLLDTKKLDDARSIAFDEQKFVVMQGTPARVTTFSIADGSQIDSYLVGGAEEAESKSMIALEKGLIFVPAGAEGLKIVKATTGEHTLEVPLPEMQDVNPAFLVTNGISVNQDKIFIANGAAGLYVAQQQQENIRVLGSVNFMASTNFVASKGDVIFVATGAGGLKIVEIVKYNPGEGDYIPIDEWDDQGVPSYLCERGSSIDQQLQQRFFKEFISMNDMVKRRPEWFGSQVVTDLMLIEDTELTITFLHEGAGHKNTLGYYTFPTAQVPLNADALQSQTMLFPNVSYSNSGGGLLRGDKICLDKFTAGTTLGFFYTTNSWHGSVISKGVYKHHTTQHFNTSHPAGMKQNSLLLYDETSGTLILTFEDIRRPGGDKDFDDAVFLIQLSNPKAIDTSKLTRLP